MLVKVEKKQNAIGTGFGPSGDNPRVELIFSTPRGYDQLDGSQYAKLTPKEVALKWVLRMLLTPGWMASMLTQMQRTEQLQSQRPGEWLDVVR